MNKSLEELQIYYAEQEKKRIKLNQFYRDKYKNNADYRDYKKKKNTENYLRRKNISNNNVVKQVSV
jgi:hypothetical protein